MWHVLGDPLYSDHWAVHIDEDQVIDLTRIQIDLTLTAKVVFALSNYPQNFGRPRFYKTAPLLDEYRNFQACYGNKLPPMLIKNLRYLMLKEDLNYANNFQHFSGIVSAILSYMKFRLNFGILEFSDHLKKRQKELSEK